MEIKGICPIAPAVYNDRGEVDLADYSSCCEKLIGLGAQALTLFGIAGEYYKMDTEEEQRLGAETDQFFAAVHVVRNIDLAAVIVNRRGNGTDSFDFHFHSSILILSANSSLPYGISP